MTERRHVYIEKRTTPIVLPKPLAPEQAENFSDNTIDRSWLLFTEAIRQEIINHVSVRDVLGSFATVPVNETLPLQAFQAVIAVSPRVAALTERWQESLVSYISLPPVPDNQIAPDISNTPNIARGLKDRGITSEERRLLAKRYRFARDIKMLALMSEMLTAQNNPEPDTAGEIHLPSGIELFVDTQNKTAEADLLNPALWEKRQQIKDRVYRITISGRTYILKEKKTLYHQHTKDKGHLDGNTSKEEVRYGQFFKRHGPVKNNNYIIDWETPLGCVTFPDGFQFAIFEDSPVLQEDGSINGYAEVLADHPEYFIHEYEVTKAIAETLLLNEDKVEEYIRQRIIKNNIHTSSLGGWMFIEQTKPKFPDHLLRRFKKPSRNAIPQISYEDFVREKSGIVPEIAKMRLQEIQKENGFVNSDQDGYLLSLDSDTKNPRVRLTAFDFEYYAPANIGDKDISQELLAEREFSILSPLMTSAKSDKDKKQRALVLAFMIQEGMHSLEDIIGVKI